MRSTWALFILLGLAAIPLQRAHGASPPQPNIVMIYADVWGWGDLSCHGHA